MMLKINLSPLSEIIESQLNTSIPQTPFHLVKSDSKYMVVLGANILATGDNLEDCQAHFNSEIWNIIFFMIFITNNGIKQIDLKTMNLL